MSVVEINKLSEVSFPYESFEASNPKEATQYLELVEREFRVGTLAISSAGVLTATSAVLTTPTISLPIITAAVAAVYPSGHWYEIINPGTGYIIEKTTWTGANNFATASGGLEYDFSAVVPVGTKAVICQTTTRNGNGIVFWRASGDTNISNTPMTQLEYSHMIDGNAGNVFGITYMRMSTDYKIQFTPSATDVDLYICYPHLVFI